MTRKVPPYFHTPNWPLRKPGCTPDCLGSLVSESTFCTPLGLPGRFIHQEMLCGALAAGSVAIPQERYPPDPLSEVAPPKCPVDQVAPGCRLQAFPAVDASAARLPEPSSSRQ